MGRHGQFMRANGFSHAHMGVHGGAITIWRRLHEVFMAVVVMAEYEEGRDLAMSMYQCRRWPHSTAVSCECRIMEHPWISYGTPVAAVAWQPTSLQ